MKLTKETLKQIIKEEAVKFTKRIQLEKELAEVTRQLDEVHAAGTFSDTENDGVHAGQRKPEFEMKGSALVEDEDTIEEELEINLPNGVSITSDDELDLEEILATILGSDDNDEAEDVDTDSEDEDNTLELDGDDSTEEEVEDEKKDEDKGELGDEEESTEEEDEKETEDKEESPLEEVNHKMLAEQKRMRELCGFKVL